MDIRVRDIYNAALAIMHENATEDYDNRVCPIVNTLVGGSWLFSERHDGGPHDQWEPVKSLDDIVRGLDTSILLSAMPYGLAAMLYLDEDPQRSNSWWGVWQENLALFRRSRPAEFEPIEDIYGGIGNAEYGRW